MWPFALQQRIVNQELLAKIRESDQNLRIIVNGLESRYIKERTDILGALDAHTARLEKLEGTPWKSYGDVAGAINEHGRRLAFLEAQLSDGQTELPDVIGEQTARVGGAIGEPGSPLFGGEAPDHGGLPRQAISQLLWRLSTKQRVVNDQLFSAVRILQEDQRSMQETKA